MELLEFGPCELGQTPMPQISSREGCSACRTRTSRVQISILAGMPPSGPVPRNPSEAFPFLWVGFFFPQ